MSAFWLQISATARRCSDIRARYAWSVPMTKRARDRSGCWKRWNSSGCKNKMRILVVLMAAFTCAGENYQWDLPPGFPVPRVPADNPMTVAKVELGRHLFYDTRLSVNGKGSCATCHKQELAFTDGRAVAVGVTGERHLRGAMSLVNIAYST